MGYPKGKPRPPGAGRKPGTPNKQHPITMDVIETMKRLGHDPIAIQIEIYRNAMARYLTCIQRRNQVGASNALLVAERANSALMKYSLPTFRSIDHKVSGTVELRTYTQIAKALLGGKEVERDVTGTEGEEESD